MNKVVTVDVALIGVGAFCALSLIGVVSANQGRHGVQQAPMVRESRAAGSHQQMRGAGGRAHRFASPNTVAAIRAQALPDFQDVALP